MKAEILTPLKLVVIVPFIQDGKWDGVHWILLSRVDGVINGKKYSIMPGFVTDWGSVPRVARMTVDRMGKALLAFLWHDFFYTDNSPISRKEADELLYNLCRFYGESWYTSRKIYLAVRSLGWTASKSENRFEFVCRSVIDHVCGSNRYWPVEPLKRKMLLN